MLRNQANQQFHCKAFTAGGAASGQASNIACTLSVDGGTRAALADTTATEIGATGEYVFDLSQAETNGHALSFVPTCSTAGVQVLGMPSNVIYTSEATSAGGGTTGTSTSLNANAQWPDAVTFAVTSNEPPYYYSDQWTLAFDVPIGIPDSERLLFSLKDGDLNTVADAASILEIELALPSTSRITRINGQAATTLQGTYGSLTYEAYPDPITGAERRRCVVTIRDDASALIAAGTYARGLKRVGESRHFVHDSMTVRAPVTKAIE